MSRAETGTGRSSCKVLYKYLRNSGGQNGNAVPVAVIFCQNAVFNGGQNGNAVLFAVILTQNACFNGVEHGNAVPVAVIFCPNCSSSSATKIFKSDLSRGLIINSDLMEERRD